MILRIAIATAVLLASACSGTESVNPPTPQQCHPDHVEQGCSLHCDALAQARTTPPTERTGSVCIPWHRGPACTCHYQRDPYHGVVDIVLRPEVGQDCLYFGRDGSCIFTVDEHLGCDVGDPTRCEATCDALEARIAADVARELTTEQTMTCDQGRCRCFLRVEDACFVDRSREPLDCNLSDQERLALHDTPPEALCETAADCTFGGGCIDGVCTDCRANADCLAGEVCLTDLGWPGCFRPENVTCRARFDCPAGQRCAVSGFDDATARGNERASTTCLPQ